MAGLPGGLDGLCSFRVGVVGLAAATARAGGDSCGGAPALALPATWLRDGFVGLTGLGAVVACAALGAGLAIVGGGPDGVGLSGGLPRGGSPVGGAPIGLFSFAGGAPAGGGPLGGAVSGGSAIASGMVNAVVSSLDGCVPAQC